MDIETQQELDATLAAREELGPGHDKELVAGFLDRIEQEIDRRVDERLAHSRRGGSHRADLGIFIPIFIILLSEGESGWGFSQNDLTDH